MDLPSFSYFEKAENNVPMLVVILVICVVAAIMYVCFYCMVRFSALKLS